MYHGRIPPHLWGGDRVTISPEAKRRLQQNIDIELEYRKGSGKITVDFENDSQLEDQKNAKFNKLADLMFVGIICLMAGFWFGMIIASVISP